MCMRKKLLAVFMAIIVCSTALPAYASAGRATGTGVWGSFWPGFFDDNNNNNDYYNNDYDDNGYYYDENGYISNRNDSQDNDDGYWYDVGEWDNDDDNGWYDDYDDASGYNDIFDEEYELDIYDIAVNPTKKEIKKGKSFYISVVPSDKSGCKGLSEEEWDIICEENIESIEYNSTNRQVATVNSFNGKVKAKKKGTTVIKTTINLLNEESITLKTKVQVNK